MFAERNFLSLSCTSCSFLHSIFVAVFVGLVDGEFSLKVLQFSLIFCGMLDKASNLVLNIFSVSSTILLTVTRIPLENCFSLLSMFPSLHAVRFRLVFLEIHQPSTSSPPDDPGGHFHVHEEFPLVCLDCSTHLFS